MELTLGKHLRFDPRRSGSFRALNLALLAGVAGIGVAAYLTIHTAPAKSAATVRTGTVSRGVVLSSVSATGSIVAATDLSVNFVSAGQLADVDVRQGQHVEEGQVLARLDQSAAREAVQQGEAALESAQENLATTMAGETAPARKQDAVSLQQARAQVTAARSTLANAKQQLAQDSRTAQQTIAQAEQQLNVRQAQQQLRADQGNERAAVAKLATDKAQLTVNGTTYATAAEAVAAWQAVVDADQARQQTDQQTLYDLQTLQTIDNQELSRDQASLSAAQAAGNKAGSRQYTGEVQEDEDRLNADALRIAALQKTIQGDGYQLSRDQSTLNTVTSLEATLSADQSSIASYEAKIASDRNAISSAQAARTNAVATARTSRATTLAKDQQAIKAAEQQLASARLSQQATAAANAVKQAPPTSGTAAQLRAAVVQAKVSLAAAQRTLEQTVLRSPVSGTVAAVNGAVGQQVAGGGTTPASAASSSDSSSAAGSTPFISLVGVSSMEATAPFAESDATKIKIGDAATVTISALSSKELAAHVVAIDATGTSSSGVVQYTVTVALDREDARLKPGMTANVGVTTDERDNVLNVPSSAVTGTGSNARVTMINDGKQSTARVVAGLEGDSTTEIVSGLHAGQTVVTSTGAANLAGLTSTTGTRSLRGLGGLGGLGGAGLSGGGVVVSK